MLIPLYSAPCTMTEKVGEMESTIIIIIWKLQSSERNSILGMFANPVANLHNDVMYEGWDHRECMRILYFS